MKQIVAALALAALPLSAAFAETVTGTATYRERIALPEGAVLEVALLDISKADVPAVQLSAQQYAASGVPVSFSLGYDPALIREGMTYSVSARLMAGDQVLFRSTSVNPVLTDGHGDSVDIVMEIMPASSGAVSLDNTDWEVLYVEGLGIIDTTPRPTIGFGANGATAIYAGCNRFRGSADISGSTIEFPPNFAGTLMACPEDVEGLERALVGVLPDIRSFAVTGSGITFLNADGTPVLRARQI